MNQNPPAPRDVNPVQRARLWYALLLVIFGVFAVRVFYLQVIRYDYYTDAARNSQLKQYEIPAERGIITAHYGGGTVPIVMNQRLFTLYADPTIIKKPEATAAKLQPVIGGNVDDITKKLKTGGGARYVILARKLTPAQSAKILGFKLGGVGTQEQDYRTYPQGSLAAQLLGFVNNDGKGEYGVEQAMNNDLKGKPGQLKAVTDVNGVPLAAKANNISIAPRAGDQVGLTIDVGMQAGVERILKAAQESNKAKDISAVVMDVSTGTIKAMANYPSYDPANYQNVDDATVFSNQTVTEPIEPGSITKVLTTAASLQEGVITPSTTFYDPGSWPIDGAAVSDVEEDHSTGQQSIFSTLDKSLNTGATWMLMQLGGGQLNFKGRTTLHNYFADHFMLGQPTGIEQGYEASGYVPRPQNTGAGINLTYANMSFGQAYTATALQMVTALSSIVNGGTYYQPRLVDSLTSADGTTTVMQPRVLKSDVVSAQTSNQMVSLLEQNNAAHIKEGFPYLNFGASYGVGGKTGTAEIANPIGGYYPDKVNGTYMGFVGGNKPQYAIVVFNMQPTKYAGFAGSGTGQPVFANIAHMLINNFGVTPRTP
ncbi:MAG TPA: penicillin-binding protein 2 [Candidatus Saccharimonadales bacterium]|nr:penicillin-binding protein 2 [Candidatus Saccharimonadales bacterium]